MTTLLNFEISVPGKTLTIEAADVVAAVPAILDVLGLTGHELMLDLNDWRGHDWFSGRNVYTSTEIIENDLELTTTDVYFNHYEDITNLVASGAWLVRNNHAYCIAHWPIGGVRKHSKRRGDFKHARKLYPSWLGKLKQLERLAINTKSRR